MLLPTGGLADRPAETPAHLLDRPVWHALSSCHAAWARRHGRAIGYDPAASPFVSTPDDCPNSLADLHGLVRGSGRGALFTTEPLTFPDTLACVRRAHVEQMVLPTPLPDRIGRPHGIEVRDLIARDGAAAQALVELTKPGPFGARTLELGRYVGAFERGALVAMAGERLRLPGHVEISAVCTHPAHRGEGLARRLIAAVAQGVFDRGLVPFLHVFADNAGAVAAYCTMGFATRRVMHLAVIEAREADGY